jgi:hypothetical protein
VHELAIARRVLDLRDPAVLGEARRDHEASIEVAGAGRDGVVLRHLEDVVGWPELPAFREHARRWKLRAIALGRACLDPLHQSCELFVRQPARIEKVAEAGDRLPRRHHAPLEGVADVVLLVEGVAVGEQRERRVLARPMTRLAARLENADDLVAEGRLLQGGRRRGEEQNGQRGREKETSPHRAPPLLIEWIQTIARGGRRIRWRNGCRRLARSAQSAVGG